MKKIRFILKSLIVLGIFYFLGKNLYLGWDQIDFKTIDLNYAILSLSFAVLILYFCLNALGWIIILNKLGVGIECFKAIKIIYYSNLGKYLPGKVWSIIGKIYLAEKEGLPRDKVVISIVLELVLGILSGFFIFLMYDRNYLSGLMLVLLSIVLLVRLARRGFLSTVLKPLLERLKINSIQIELSFSGVLIVFGYYCLLWFFAGSAFFLLINSLTLLSVLRILDVTAIFAFSFVTGLLAVFVPAGLGVREGVMVYFLSNFLPVPTAILISFLARIWIILGNVVMAFIAASIDGKKEDN